MVSLNCFTAIPRAIFCLVANDVTNFLFCLTFFLLLDPAEGTAEGLSMEAEVGWGAALVVAGAGKDSGTGCKVGVRILLVTGTRIQEYGHSKLLFS